ncbi:MAG: smalltalk protein [Bacteroidaceae bacterium]|nr:smalltalk protein [Bacteroidaceae bacterium]
MKKETWKFIIQTVMAILTAIATSLGVTSCMGHGPVDALALI